MRNINIEHDAKSLIIKVDLDGDYRPSKSGKTDILASTEGAILLSSGLVLNLNCYRKPQSERAS